MQGDEPKKRGYLNAAQKRALKAATVGTFLVQYGRRARRGLDPNDRSYDRDVEKALKQMKPEQLDQLVRDDED